MKKRKVKATPTTTNTYAQWDETIVDLGKTITLTVVGIGRIRFENNSGSYMESFDGPFENKQINMPPDAFIGKMDIDEDYYYEGITLNGQEWDIDIGTVNDGDVIIATWKAYAPKPDPIENETWLWFRRPYSDTWNQPMAALIINEATYSDSSTWIKVDKFGTDLDRVYGVHLPDGTYFVMPLIYDTGTAYKYMNPKRLVIQRDMTYGGYSSVNMHWMPIRISSYETENINE